MFRLLHIIPCFWPFLQYSPLKQYQQLLVSIKKTKISRDTTKLESYRESLYLKETFLILLLYILLVDSLVHHEFLRSLGSLWYMHIFRVNDHSAFLQTPSLIFFKESKIWGISRVNTRVKGEKVDSTRGKGYKIVLFSFLSPLLPLKRLHCRLQLRASTLLFGG